MDARALLPDGWHPQNWQAYLNGSTLVFNLSRTAVGGVRYYYIDFGISTFRESLVTGIHGQERAPELSETAMYDPYKLDVYILGKAYSEYIDRVSGVCHAASVHPDWTPDLAMSTARVTGRIYTTASEVHDTCRTESSSIRCAGLRVLQENAGRSL